MRCQNRSSVAESKVFTSFLRLDPKRARWAEISPNLVGSFIFFQYITLNILGGHFRLIQVSIVCVTMPVWYVHDFVCVCVFVRVCERMCCVRVCACICSCVRVRVRVCESVCWFCRYKYTLSVNRSGGTLFLGMVEGRVLNFTWLHLIPPPFMPLHIKSNHELLLCTAWWHVVWFVWRRRIYFRNQGGFAQSWARIGWSYSW